MAFCGYNRAKVDAKHMAKGSGSPKQSSGIEVIMLQKHCWLVLVVVCVCSIIVPYSCFVLQ